MPYSAATIAYCFVKKGIDENNYVSQMKLQKMVYLAHGYHLAIFGEPLIQEKFQAWEFGPVIPELYHQYKFYGSDAIVDTYLVSSAFNLENQIDLLDEKAIQAIGFTWDVSSRLSAIQLSNWTHQEGSPWAKHFEGKGARGVIIPNEEITSYFKELLFRKPNAESATTTA